MELNMNIKANLTSDDVLQIVKSHLEKEGYVVSNITPEVGTREVGHQMNSYTEAYFKGIEAEIRVKPVKQSENNNYDYRNQMADFYNK